MGSPAATPGPSACGPQWPGAEEREAVNAVHVSEHGEQVTGGRPGCQPAVTAVLKNDKIDHTYN